MMKEVFMYLFLGVPFFYDAPLPKTAQPRHVVVEMCKFPRSAIFYDEERPVRVGDTILVYTYNSSEFVYAKIVEFQE